MSKKHSFLAYRKQEKLLLMQKSKSGTVRLFLHLLTKAANACSETDSLSCIFDMGHFLGREAENVKVYLEIQSKPKITDSIGSKNTTGTKAIVQLLSIV